MTETGNKVFGCRLSLKIILVFHLQTKHQYLSRGDGSRQVTLSVSVWAWAQKWGTYLDVTLELGEIADAVCEHCNDHDHYSFAVLKHETYCTVVNLLREP